MSGLLRARLVAMFGAALCCAGCTIVVPVFTPPRGERMVLETLERAQKPWTQDKILLVGLDGPLSDDPTEGGMFGGDTSALVLLKDTLKRAEKNSDIQGILLRINSSGGTVTASDIIYTELRRYKERTGKKITVMLMDVAASGGYYVAMSGDRILAHPTTITGSIGVVALFPNVGGLGQKIGFDMRVIKSGPYKDLGSIWRGFSDEESAILKALIDSFYQRFLAVVREGRPRLDAETIRGLADGRVFTAQQALDLGLVDGIGYMDDALKAAREVSGLDDAALVVYRRPHQYRGHYYAQTMGAQREGPAQANAPARTQINLLNLDWRGLPPSGTSPFHYLWIP